jgi:hypothetical protein
MISANVYADDSGVDYSFGTGAMKGSSGWAILMVFGSIVVGGGKWVLPDLVLFVYVLWKY